MLHNRKRLDKPQMQYQVSGAQCLVMQKTLKGKLKDTAKSGRTQLEKKARSHSSPWMWKRFKTNTKLSQWDKSKANKLEYTWPVCIFLGIHVQPRDSFFPNLYIPAHSAYVHTGHSYSFIIVHGAETLRCTCVYSNALPGI